MNCVQRNGNGNGEHVAGNDEKKVIEDRIAQGLQCVIIAEQKLEILQADPRACENTQGVIDFLKSNYQTAHWQVVVHYQIDQAGDQHKIQGEELLEFFAPFAADVVFFRIRQNCFLRGFHRLLLCHRISSIFPPSISVPEFIYK